MKGRLLVWSLLLTASVLPAEAGPKQRLPSQCPDTAREPIPPMTDCRAHMKRCLETRLGDIGSAGPGLSICSACLRFCEGQGGYWHESTDVHDCRWWKY